MKVYYKCKLKSMSGSCPVEINNFMFGSSEHYKFDKKYPVSLIYAKKAKEFLRLYNESDDMVHDCFSSDELTEIFKNDLYLRFEKTGIDDITMIFEIVESEDGIKYAKEIITGLLFPFKGELIVKSIELDMDVSNKLRESYVGATLLLDIKYPSMAKCAEIITTYEVADKIEIENYLKKASSTSTEISLYIPHFTNKYNKNVFDREIRLKKEEKVQMTSEEISSISHIEYYINYLESIKDEESISFRKEYSTLLKYIDDKYTNMPVSKDNLFELESRIKFYVFFNEKTNYLSNEVINLENSVFNSEILESISFIEIDNLFNLFLKYKDNMELEEQSIIVNHFSKLYLLSIIKEKIDKSIIGNSHFNDLLYLIVKSYNEYCEEGYFENKILSKTLDSNKVLEELLNSKVNVPNQKKLV